MDKVPKILSPVTVVGGLLGSYLIYKVFSKIKNVIKDAVVSPVPHPHPPIRPGAEKISRVIKDIQMGNKEIK